MTHTFVAGEAQARLDDPPKNFPADIPASNSLADLAARIRGASGLIKFEPPPGTKTSPYLDCFRMMTEHEFAGLVWSVKRWGGLLCPISLDQDGVILDGRCRLMACLVTGIEPTFETIDLGDEDPRDFIIRKNVIRAHHTPHQRAIAEAILETLLEPDPEFSALVLPEARVVLEFPELAEAVKQGTMGLPQAYEQALACKQEAAHRREQAARLERFRKESPCLAMRVDDGALTLEEAIETAKEEAAAPILAEHAEAIRTIGKRVVADLIEIGRRLTECRPRLRHGQWGAWLEREFGWSDSSAARYMQAHELAVKFPNLGDLDVPISGLYLLAQPSAPAAIREEILTRAQSERIPHAEVKRLIDDARGKRPSLANRFHDDLRDLVDRMADAMPDDPLVAELRQLVSGESHNV